MNVYLIDKTRDSDPFHGLHELWGAIPRSIQPECNIKTIWMENAGLDSEFLASLLQFTPPLRTFCWGIDEICLFSWQDLQEHSKNSLETLAYVDFDSESHNIEFIQEFQCLRTIQLIGQHPPKSLAKFLPKSVEKLYFTEAHFDYPHTFSSLFEEFDLARFPKLRSISFKMLVDSIFEHTGGYVNSAPDLPIIELVRKPFDVLVEALTTLNPKVLNCTLEQIESDTYECLLEGEDFLKLESSRFLVPSDLPKFGGLVERDNLPSVLLAFKVII